MKAFRYGPDDPIVVRYIEYCAKAYNLSTATLKCRRHDIRRWLGWLTKNSKTYMNASTEDVLNLKAHMEARNLAKVSITNQLGSAKHFHEWLMDNKIRTDEFWPRKTKVIDRHEHPIRVPLAHQIFTMRRKRKMALRDIAIFELMLSSGVRSQVIQQMRTSDLSFEHNVKDAYTGKKVDCIGGSINVDPRRMVLKNKKPYIAYFSQAAARWLKVWYNENNLWKHPNMPLFPVPQIRLVQAMERIGGNIPIMLRHDKNASSGLEREAFNKDIEPDDMDIPEGMKHLIKNSQRRSETMKGLGEHAMKLHGKSFNSSTSALPRSEFMRPHTLRHFFAGMMFWKCYDGARRDFIRVGKLLGHTRLSSLETYLDRIDCVTTDQEWNRLVYGQAQDWLGFYVRRGGGMSGIRKMPDQHPPYTPQPIPKK